jgi:hypothetical protein
MASRCSNSDAPRLDENDVKSMDVFTRTAAL